MRALRLVGPRPAAAADLVDKQYVDAATAVNIEPVIVDFGDGETTATGSVMATWVRPDSLITCTPDPAGTDDHGAEDAVIEGVRCVVTYVEPGIGFDVLAVCPEETFGRYLFNCVEA